MLRLDRDDWKVIAGANNGHAINGDTVGGEHTAMCLESQGDGLLTGIRERGVELRESGGISWWRGGRGGWESGTGERNKRHGRWHVAKCG